MTPILLVGITWQWELSLAVLQSKNRTAVVRAPVPFLQTRRRRLGHSKCIPTTHRPGLLNPRVVRLRSLAIKLKFLTSCSRQRQISQRSSSPMNRSSPPSRHPTLLIHGDSLQRTDNRSSNVFIDQFVRPHSRQLEIMQTAHRD